MPKFRLTLRSTVSSVSREQHEGSGVPYASHGAISPWGPYLLHFKSPDGSIQVPSGIMLEPPYVIVVEYDRFEIANRSDRNDRLIFGSANGGQWNMDAIGNPFDSIIDVASGEVLWQRDAVRANRS